jgi:pectate lyase
MMKRRTIFASCAAVAMVMLSAAAHGDTVTVVATQGKVGSMDLTNSSVADAVQPDSRLKTRSSANTNHKSWLQFDLNDIYASNPGLKGHVTGATLTFTGTVDNTVAKPYIVNGLNDSAGLESWSASSLTWNNAPGNNIASGSALDPSVTTASLVAGSITPGDGATDSRTSDALTAFVNTDSDGLVTVILTPGGTAYFYNAGSVHPPTLALSTDVEPANTIKAFLGAEGFGAYAKGGRGGDVYHVTNLNDSGAGSLRNGITTAGGTWTTGRTIVFDVSGTIILTSGLDISKSYITIAGQTAPGDGICLRDYHLGISASHVIIRYIRCRLGDETIGEDDTVGIYSGHHIIVDHVTASWSVDENLSCTTADPVLGDVTVQWSLITEALNNSTHSKGQHGYGALIRGCHDAKYTYHHNLWVHNTDRNPRPGNYDSLVEGGNPYWDDPNGLLFDFRNNVIYNWKGSRPGADADLDSVCRYNYVGNWAKPGANSTAGYLYSAGCKYFRGYYTGNYFNGTYSTDPCNGDWPWVYFSGTWSSAQKAAYKMSVPFDTGPIATDTALIAYQRILNHAGASLPKRDTVDSRVVSHVLTNAGAVIDSQNQVGGWPVLNSTAAPLDTDQDGMPDAWETAHGLVASDAADRNGYDLDPNYTNLEVYLNSLVPNGVYDTDVTPPLPGTVTWQEPPAAVSGTQVKMTASPATDPWGVEYSFICTSGGGHSSGWQASNSYTDSGLTPGQTYTYTAMARDKSAAHNETAPSGQASATTLPYACTAGVGGDIDGDCQVSMKDFATLAGAWPTPGAPVNLVTNGDFAADTSGWTLANLTGASGTVTASWSGAEGSPAGAAYLQKPDSTSITKKHRFYQVFPVTSGHRYRFSGEWKGSIIGSIVNNPSETVFTTLNEVRVYVGWSQTAAPDWGVVTAMYRKSINARYQWNVGVSGMWGWEAITASRAWSVTPTDATFTAAGNYMVIALDLQSKPSSGATWIYLDNVRVEEVPACPSADLNADCLVNMKDMAAMAANWLGCNRSPTGQCWQ